MKTFDTDRVGGRRSGVLNAIWRVLQIIGACVIIGYYATDLRAAAREHKYSDSKWVRLTHRFFQFRRPGQARRSGAPQTTIQAGVCHVFWTDSSWLAADCRTSRCPSVNPRLIFRVPSVVPQLLLGEPLAHPICSLLAQASDSTNLCIRLSLLWSEHSLE